MINTVNIPKAPFKTNPSILFKEEIIGICSKIANNFFNNMGQVKSSKTGNYVSLGSTQQYIPGFFYGLTVRLKF